MKILVAFTISLGIRVNREFKKSKKTYKTYFEDSKSEIKKTWEGIKSLINNSNSPLKISQSKNNGRIIDDSEGIAAGLNNFFVNVGPNAEKDVPVTPSD